MCASLPLKVGIWLVCGAALVGAAGQAARADDTVQSSTVLEGSGRWNFASLDWRGATPLEAGSGPTLIGFDLPADAAQGVPLWYGIELGFEWTGVPANESPLYLSAKWNGHAVLQLKVTARPDISGEAIEWSTVDDSVGHSAGIEISGRFRGVLSNYAQVRSVRAGSNQLTFAINTLDGKTHPVQVRIDPESSIIASSVGPPEVQVIAGGMKVEGDRIQLSAELRNTGSGADAVTIETYLIYEDGAWEVRRESIGRVDTTAGQEHTWTTEPGPRFPQRIALSTRYATGSQIPVVVWPRSEESLLDRASAAAPSSVGILVAIVFIWIALPYAIGRVRQ